MTFRRDFLTMTGGAMAAVAVLPIAAQAAFELNPDAELIRACAEHVINIRNYNRDGGTLPEDEPDPLWFAYEDTRDFIAAARPKTLVGMQAKARAAKAEATTPGGEESPDGTPGQDWAWDLLNDLLGLEPGSDGECPTCI